MLVTRIAYFVSPHGLGHAARSAAVMAALIEKHPACHFHIFTTVSEWFFQDTLFGNFKHYDLLTDVGLVQHSPLQEDIAGTFHTLDHFLPFDPEKINKLSQQIKDLGCSLVICDIAPMGILVAQKASLTSILVENFTWDWIYEKYIDLKPSVENHIEYLQHIFEMADFHIQATPACTTQAVDLVALPVSRKTRIPRPVLRKQLNLPEESKAVLITMGGISERFTFFKQLRQKKDIHFIIPGAVSKMKQIDNLHLLPFHSTFYHPDLVNAADAVIGKLGYSTLAEVFHAGVPFGYISRSSFRESQKLVDYVEKEMPGLPIEESTFHEGRWVSRVQELLSLPGEKRNGINGADQIADFVLALEVSPTVAS